MPVINACDRPPAHSIAPTELANAGDGFLNFR
jgi:hypothetical protein